MVKENYKFIGDLTEDELERAPVLSFKSENGKHCIFIRNSKNKTLDKTGSTDYLEYKLNSSYTRNCKTYYFHRIACKNADITTLEQFDTIFKYLFKKIQHPIKDDEILKLIFSLEELFKVTPTKNKENLRIGLYGELLFLHSIFTNGYKKILEKYHSNFFSKHDIELNDKIRIEIKTTTKESRIHNFRHNQISRTDLKVYVGSVLLEQSDEGLSLYDLCEILMNESRSADFDFDLDKLMKFVEVSDHDKGPSFSYQLALDKIRIIEANKLPHLDISDVNGVTNISYDVECALADYMNASQFIKNIENV